MAFENEKWILATTQVDGKQLLFRIRSNAPTFASKAAFPHALTVSWPYEAADAHGMPSEDEVARMSKLEDLLGTALEDSEAAFLAVIATGDNLREWQWYARSPEQVLERVNASLRKKPPFPIEFSAYEDPAWFRYERFQHLCGDAGQS